MAMRLHIANPPVKAPISPVQVIVYILNAGVRMGVQQKPKPTCSNMVSRSTRRRQYFSMLMRLMVPTHCIHVPNHVFGGSGNRSTVVC